MLFNFPSTFPAPFFPATGRFANPERSVSRGLKRVFDVIGVIPLILLSLPVWLGVALLIKVETPGSILFSQTRIGRGGTPFRMWKFRSMVQGAEAFKRDLQHENDVPGGVLFKMRRDPRVTRLGQVLRRTSLDETPQFLNVLLGHMSLVGPRPPVPEEVAQYTPHQMGRLGAKPGLTCLWQVGGRSWLPFEQQVDLDLEYIRRRSFWLDLGILLRTIPAVLTGRGAF